MTRASVEIALGIMFLIIIIIQGESRKNSISNLWTARAKFELEGWCVDRHSESNGFYMIDTQ